MPGAPVFLMGWATDFWVISQVRFDNPKLVHIPFLWLISMKYRPCQRAGSGRTDDLWDNHDIVERSGGLRAWT
ncbi:hypothetical protein C812_00527 [Paenibacillus barengoltzii G22]|uniref:Uncharacterized protein n=1 Tax=Paenibacillus barengoltzii G22 TaxID=1235795 RepID=R9LIP7_9BACL|nr:hypothetical protein C812_00527 [Paenibacillus barengoltzii G22]